MSKDDMKYYAVPLLILIFLFMAAVEWSHNNKNSCHPDGFPDGRKELGLEPIPCIVEK